jgi:phosphoribosyl-ATP pyrophosphohydrolase/phosphoribosyl-AMP cyclohydrolase
VTSAGGGLSYDERGLIVAVAQDRLTGQVRMVAWMNREALARTLATGRATFYSRSRQALWEKGEQSGHSMIVHAVYGDCDGDTLLLLVDPLGPSCHTGQPSCFFRRVGPEGELVDSPRDATAFLDDLGRVIRERRGESSRKSYTKSLLEGGPLAVGAKLREEADELARAIGSESDERVAAEAADLLYHLLVGLELRGLDVRSAVAVLAERAGVGGHEEKARRGPR